MKNGDSDGRARLLAAALRLFGERGYAATSVTDLAAEARVTRGLIRFHFGSKQGLSDAVDHYVIERITSTIEAFVAHTPARITEQFLMRVDQLEGERDIQNYLRRALLDPTPHSKELFKSIFLAQRHMIEQFSALGAPQLPIGENWLALISLFLQFGLLVFRPQLEMVLGRDPLSSEGEETARVYSTLFRHLFNLDSIQTENHS